MDFVYFAGTGLKDSIRNSGGDGGVGSSFWAANDQGIHYNDKNVGIGEFLGNPQGSPEFLLHVRHLNAGLSNGLGIQNDVDQNNNWNLHVSSEDQSLIFVNKGNLKVRFKPDGTVEAISDRRLKKNIVRPVGVLSQILALKPSIYEMINKSW